MANPTIGRRYSLAEFQAMRHSEPLLLHDSYTPTERARLLARNDPPRRRWCFPLLVFVVVIGLLWRACETTNPQPQVTAYRKN